MPKISEVFPESDTEWLKVDDLQKRARRVTVKDVEIIQVKDFNDPTVKKSKAMVTLVETQKRYIANVTSARAIAAAYGDDTDSWIGKKIILKPHMYPNGHEGILGEPVYEESDGFGDAPRTEVPAAIKEVAAAFNTKKEKDYFEKLESDENIPF